MPDDNFLLFPLVGIVYAVAPRFVVATPEPRRAFNGVESLFC